MLERLYCVMAEIIEILVKNTKETFLQDYFVLSPNAKKQIDKEIAKRFPEILEEETGQYRELGTEELEEAFWEGLRGFIAEYQKKEEYEYLLKLLERLDLCMEKVSRGELIMGRGYQGIEALNENWKKTGVILLPRASCLWERYSRGSRYFNRIDNFMRNFYPVMLTDLGEYRIKNIILSEREFFQTSGEKGYFRVGISPLDNATDLKSCQYEDGIWQRFRVDGIVEEERLYNQIIEVLRKARSEQVQVLLFPEMLGTEEICSKIKSYLEEVMLEAEGICYPEIVIFPSIWHEYKNYSVLLDSAGEEICRQEKHYPYEWEDKKTLLRYMEDIRSEKIIYLLHHPCVGRMAVAICMDFLKPDYIRLLADKLKVTLLFVPSFTSGNHDFNLGMRGYEYADCTVVWVNSCSVQGVLGVDEEKMNWVGSVNMTGKNADMGIDRLLREEHCNGGICNKPCLHIADIPLKK